MNGSPQSTVATAIPSLSRQRLADQIADILREQMLTGLLQPGHAIHERETSAALGVSRTPLREAILILEAEGLVDTAPARSPVVANPSVEELTNLLLVQAALEALAGEQACANATDAEIRAIRDLHEQILISDSSADTVSHFKTDMMLHEAIVQSTKNQPLIKTHKQYNSRLWRARYVSSSLRLGRASSMKDHRLMVEALERRDGTETARVMRSHLESAIENIIKTGQGNPGKTEES
ncbi:MAG: GntR family transcriptional regulator [Paracoccaceae bacterium]